MHNNSRNTTLVTAIPSKKWSYCTVSLFPMYPIITKISVAMSRMLSKAPATTGARHNAQLDTPRHLAQQSPSYDI